MHRHLFLLMCLVFPLRTHGLTIPEFPKLIVTGTATIHKPADEVRFKIGVVSQNEKANIAVKMNREQVQKIVKMLNDMGLNSKDYETEQFTLEPVYKPYPKNPPPDWKQEIIGYRVDNKISIKLSQFDLAAKIMDLAATSGVDSVEIMEFGVQNPEQYFSEVITAAAKNAISEADTLAQATHQRLKRVMELSLENVAGGKRHLNHPSFAPRMMAIVNESSTPIEGGQVEFSATVHMTYEIEGVQAGH